MDTTTSISEDNLSLRTYFFVNLMNNSFSEHADETAMYCLYWILWSLGIQYKQDKSFDLLFIESS